jgi:hypothetical protein
MPRQRRDSCEKTEGTVNVQPGVVLAGQRDHFLQRVEITGVHVARSRDDDGGLPVKGSQRRGESGYVEASRRVARQDLRALASNAEHAQRFDHAGVEVAAREHRHRRESGEAVCVDVYPMLQSPPPARGRQADKVRCCSPCRQHRAPLSRNPKQVLEPGEADLLETRCKRRADPVVGVLVQRGRQPVGGEGRGCHPSGDVMEISRSRRPGSPIQRCGDQLRHRLQRPNAVRR